MSQLPRIPSTRSSNINTEVDSTNITNKVSTPNKISEEQKLVLPEISTEINKMSIRNPLVINTKIAELETKLINMEQNFQYAINKITQNELKISDIESKNFQNLINENPKIPIPENQNEEISSTQKEFAIINNKINYIEQLMKKNQEQIFLEKQKELDFNKKLLNKINSSLTNTIQLEIEQRFKGDLLQKNSNIKEIDLLQNQINNIKNDIDQKFALLKKEIEENNNECSERNQQLAKYIDTQLNEHKLLKETRELRNFTEKLTNQIKINMINQTKTNETLEKKFNDLTNKIPKELKEAQDFVAKIEKRVMQRVLQMKNYIEINILSNNNIIAKEIRQISEKVTKDLSFLANELIIYQNNSLIEFQNLDKKIQYSNKTLISDLESVAERQILLENIVRNKYKNIEALNKNFLQQIALMEAKLTTNLTQEKVLRICDNEKLYTQINSVSSNVTDTNKALFTNLNNLIKENTNKESELNTKFEQIFDMLNKSTQHMDFIEKDCQETLTKVIINEMTQKSIEEKISQELARVNLFEASIKYNRQDIHKLNDRIVDAFKSLGGISKQGEKIHEMMVEKEMREDVDKLMNKLLEEVSLINLKDETENRVQSLSNRMYENKFKQENDIKSLNSKINNVNKYNEDKINSVSENLNKKIDNNTISTTISEFYTNVEIENLYQNVNEVKKGAMSKLDDETVEKVLQKIEENNDVTKQTLANYSDIIDNKVNKTLEKVKQDNIDMWANSVSLSQKMNSPEEIKKVITEIPPVIMPINETLQQIMNLNFKHENPKPFLPDLYEYEKDIDESEFGIILENKNKEDKENALKDDLAGDGKKNNGVNNKEEKKSNNENNKEEKKSNKDKNKK